MLEIKNNIGIRFQYFSSLYVKGKGSTPKWLDFTYLMGDKEQNIFPAQWRNAFGGELIQAESLNIKQLATIRMGFNPQLYEILKTKQVRIFQNNETDETKAFSLYGSCDNVYMADKVLEFKVHRLEVK